MKEPIRYFLLGAFFAAAIILPGRVAAAFGVPVPLPITLKMDETALTAALKTYAMWLKQIEQWEIEVEQLKHLGKDHSDDVLQAAFSETDSYYQETPWVMGNGSYLPIDSSIQTAAAKKEVWKQTYKTLDDIKGWTPSQMAEYARNINNMTDEAIMTAAAAQTRLVRVKEDIRALEEELNQTDNAPGTVGELQIHNKIAELQAVQASLMQEITARYNEAQSMREAQAMAEAAMAKYGVILAFRGVPLEDIEINYSSQSITPVSASNYSFSGNVWSKVNDAWGRYN